MNKRAISVTLDPDNLTWVRAQVLSSGARSVSQVLDRLIEEARARGGERGAGARTVIGLAHVASSDPDLSTGDSAVRALFASHG